MRHGRDDTQRRSRHVQKLDAQQPLKRRKHDMLGSAGAAPEAVASAEMDWCKQCAVVASAVATAAAHGHPFLLGDSLRPEDMLLAHCLSGRPSALGASPRRPAPWRPRPARRAPARDTCGYDRTRVQSAAREGGGVRGWGHALSMRSDAVGTVCEIREIRK